MQCFYNTAKIVMFCEKCGKELPEGVTVCDACSVPESNVTESSAAPVVEDTPVVPQPAPTPDENISTPSLEEQPKKSKKGKLVAIVAAAAVVLLAAAVLLNLTAVEGFFIKNFGSDEAYFQYIEEETFSDFAAVTSSLYGDFISAYNPTNGSNEVKLDLELSDDLLMLAQSALGEDMDLDWLKNISMIVSANVDDQKQESAIKLLLGNATLLDVSVLLDRATNDIFLGIPSLSDLYISMGEAMDNAMSATPAFTVTTEMLEALPTEDEINALLNKYLNIIFEDFGKVSKETEEVELGNCSQSLTVLEYKLTAKDLIKLAKTILKELKSDEDVKGYIRDFEDFISTEYGDLLDESYEEGILYDSFKEAINELIDEISAVEAPNVTVFELTDYINSGHEVVGREIEFGGMELFSYLSVVDGSDYAYEASCESAGLSIRGEGTKKGDTISAEYDVIVNEISLVEVSLEDFDSVEMTGDILIAPSSQLLDLALGSGSSSVVAMFDPAIKISLGDESASLSLLSKNDALITLSLSTQTGNGDSIEMPDENQVVSLKNVDAWTSSLDLSKLVDALEEAGVPSDLLTMLESALENIDPDSLFDSDAIGIIGGAESRAFHSA